MESQKHFLHIWVFWGTKVHPIPLLWVKIQISLIYSCDTWKERYWGVEYRCIWKKCEKYSFRPKKGEKPLKRVKIGVLGHVWYAYSHPFCDPSKPNFFNSFGGIYNESMESQILLCPLGFLKHLKFTPTPFMAKFSYFPDIVVWHIKRKVLRRRILKTQNKFIFPLRRA